MGREGNLAHYSTSLILGASFESLDPLLVYRRLPSTRQPLLTPITSATTSLELECIHSVGQRELALPTMHSLRPLLCLQLPPDAVQETPPLAVLPIGGVVVVIKLHLQTSEFVAGSAVHLMVEVQGWRVWLWRVGEPPS